jgi:tetratricopeptide (TPR) repeat protein
LYQTEDYDGVVEQYHELYEQNPNDTETAIQYARLLMAKGEQDEAYSIYDRLLTENPKNKEVYESLLEIYEQRNDMVAKRSLLHKMRKQFPNEESLLEKIAETYELEEKWDLARETYDSLRASTDDSSVDLAIARTWEQQDSLLKALEVYRGAVEEYPNDTDLLHRKGATEETLGKYQEALQTYQDLVNIQENSKNHFRLGRVYEALDDTEKTLEHYLEAIDLGIDEPSSYFGVARIVISDDQDRAFKFTKDALEHALTKVKVEQQQLANKLNEQDNLFGINAKDEYGKQLETYDQLAEDIFSFMTRNFEQERVLPFLGELESKYPNSGRLLYLQSIYYGEINNTEKQFKLLKQAVELQPGLVDPHLALGDYYVEQGHTIKAIGSFERALSIAPEEAKPYKKLIDLYRDTEQLDQLIDRWKARYRARPENEVLREHLIEALHKANRYEEAREVIDNDF